MNQKSTGDKVWGVSEEQNTLTKGILESLLVSWDIIKALPNTSNTYFKKSIFVHVSSPIIHLDTICVIKKMLCPRMKGVG